MAEIKISDLTPKGANLIATDLLVISEDIGGGLYETKSITGDEVLNAVAKTAVAVRNQTGVTIYKGTIVYISGASGGKALISKAQANSEITSSKTLGVVTADIANNANGNVLTNGLLTALDTRTTATNPFTADTLAIGDDLYLSPTNAGYVTNIKPIAPNNLVNIGKVLETSATTGQILYAIVNGYELGELHNVDTTGEISGDVLSLNGGIWKPRAILSDTITDGEITKAPTQNAVFDALALKENNLPSMVGNSLKVLRVNAGETAKEWATISTGLTIGTTPITSGTVGRVLFEGAGNVVQENTDFSYADNCLNLSQYLGGTTRQLYLSGGRSFGMDVAWSGANTTAIRVVNSGSGTNVGISSNVYNGTNNYAFYSANGDIVAATGKLGVGTASPAAKLDVKAQGALSTDIAFRVRNSADTGNILTVQGDAGIVHNGRYGLNTATNSGIDFFINAGSGSSYGIYAIGTYGVAGISSRPDTATTNYNFHASACARFGAYYAGNAGGGSTVTGIRKGFVADAFNANAFDNIAFQSDITNAGGGGAIAFDIVNGNIRFGTGTGTKIATTTSQKIAFWNATPIVQPTTTISAAALVSNAGTNLTSTDTFDGYTMQQVVKALRNCGILA